MASLFFHLLFLALTLGSLSYLFLSFRCGIRSRHFLVGETTRHHPLGFLRIFLLRSLATVQLPLLRRFFLRVLPVSRWFKFLYLLFRHPVRRNSEPIHLFLPAFLLALYFLLLLGYTCIFLHLLFSNSFYLFDFHNLYTWLEVPKWHWWFWKCPTVVDAAYVEGYSHFYWRRPRPRSFRFYVHLQQGHFRYVPYLCLTLLILLPFQLSHASLAYRHWNVLKNTSTYRYHLLSVLKPRFAKRGTFLTPPSRRLASMEQDGVLLHRRVYDSLVKRNWLFGLILLCHLLLLIRWIYGYGYDPFLDFQVFLSTRLFG